MLWPRDRVQAAGVVGPLTESDLAQAAAPGGGADASGTVGHGPAPNPRPARPGSLSAVLLLAFALGTALTARDMAHPALGWPLVGAVVLLALWWSRTRADPPTWSLWAFAAAMAGLFAVEPRPGPLMALSLVGTAIGVQRLPDRSAATFGGAVAALALLAGARERLQLGSSRGLVDMVVTYSVGFGGLVTWRQRTRHHRETERLLAELAEEHRRLEAAHARLAEHARNVAELAASEERGRIAREIHDLLAHALTAIIVQAEAATVRLRTDPPAAAQQIHSLAALARSALQEARLSVAAIRADPGAAGVDALRRLCAEAERWSGMRCTFSLRGGERPLPAPVAHAAYRILQEALTNARRHGRATRVEVALTFGADLLTLAVDNDLPGQGAETPPRDLGQSVGGLQSAGAVPGSGLRGMRERAQSLGGSLEAGARAGGFHVCASLPLPADGTPAPGGWPGPADGGGAA